MKDIVDAWFGYLTDLSWDYPPVAIFLALLTGVATGYFLAHSIRFLL